MATLTVYMQCDHEHQQALSGLYLHSGACACVYVCVCDVNVCDCVSFMCISAFIPVCDSG